MPVVKYHQVERQPIEMEGVAGVSKANVIGPDLGWKENTLRVFRLEPGGFTPHHQHDWEHVNYVIKGKGTLTIGDETVGVAEKDFAFVPPNTKHQFKNPFGEPFEFICIVPDKGAY